MRAGLSCLFIIVQEVDLKNVSPTFRLNLRAFCWHIDRRLEVSFSVLQEFPIDNSNGIIWKTKNFFWVFCSISGIYIKFQTFRKKRWWSLLMYFRTCRLWKTSPDHSVKGVVSEHALTVNMWNCPKYLRNIHESAFIMWFHHFGRSCFGKFLPYY